MNKSLNKEKSLNSLLQTLGLHLIGVVNVTRDDRIPDISNKMPSRQLLLIGNGGSSLWPVFSQSDEFRDGMPNPLDRWSRRVGNALADELDGRAIFPFEGPPYAPFSSWAIRTGKVVSSRLSLLIHERFGLWHAYRFAVALPHSYENAVRVPAIESPCLTCTDKPCLQACPVDAFDNRSYQTELCMDYLREDSTSSCRTGGCEARRACPAGAAFTYLPSHAKFHMDAYVETRNSQVVSSLERGIKITSTK